MRRNDAEDEEGATSFFEDHVLICSLLLLGVWYVVCFFALRSAERSVLKEQERLGSDKKDVG